MHFKFDMLHIDLYPLLNAKFYTCTYACKHILVNTVLKYLVMS